MTEATAAPASPILKIELPNLDGARDFDCTTIPVDTRLDLLKQGTQNYIRNRINAVAQRHAKDADVIAWAAFDEASKADPLQTVVPKPQSERPAAPNYEEAYQRAIADLIAGNIRKHTGEPKTRAKKDPLIKAVTDIVVGEVYEARKAENAKYSFFDAKKEVGGDGIAYLNAMIEAKVAQGVDRALLEKMRDTRYINPAKTMLGLNTPKALSELPSIL